MAHDPLFTPLRVGPLELRSPRETFAQFHTLWFDRALTRNTLVINLMNLFLYFPLPIVLSQPMNPL